MGAATAREYASIRNLDRVCCWGAARVLGTVMCRWQNEVIVVMVKNWASEQKAAAIEEARLEKDRLAHAPTPVRLHVYLISAAGSAGSAFGAYHSGIEVHGKEYSYGFNDSSTAVSGVWVCEPMQPGAGFQYEQTIMQAQVQLSKVEALQTVKELAREWKGQEYDLVNHNCNDFCEALSIKLLGVGIPAWVNRLARFGAGLGLGGRKNKAPEVLHKRGDVVQADTEAMLVASDGKRRAGQEPSIAATEGFEHQAILAGAVSAVLNRITIIEVLSRQELINTWQSNMRHDTEPIQDTKRQPPILPRLQLGPVLAVQATETPSQIIKATPRHRAYGNIAEVPPEQLLALAQQLAEGGWRMQNRIVQVVLLWRMAVAESYAANSWIIAKLKGKYASWRAETIKQECAMERRRANMERKLLTTASAYTEHLHAGSRNFMQNTLS